MIHASARTLNGASLAVPRRVHASAGRWRNKSRWRWRTWRTRHQFRERDARRRRTPACRGSRRIPGSGVASAAGDPERAIGHDPLRVGQVQDDLLHAPLARRVPVGAAGLGNAAEPRQRFVALPGEEVEDVDAGGRHGRRNRRNTVAYSSGPGAETGVADTVMVGLSAGGRREGLRKRPALLYLVAVCQQADQRSQGPGTVYGELAEFALAPVFVFAADRQQPRVRA